MEHDLQREEFGASDFETTYLLQLNQRFKILPHGTNGGLSELHHLSNDGIDGEFKDFVGNLPDTPEGDELGKMARDILVLPEVDPTVLNKLVEEFHNYRHSK